MHPLGRNVRLHPLLLACVLLLSHASVPAFAQLSAGSSAFVNTASLSGSSTPSASAASTSSASTTTAPKHTQFILSGTSKPKTTSEEAIELLSNSTNTDRPTSTTAHAGPVNTQPCNLYLEFCDRSYGLITQVGTHNSPFVRPNNAAANQKLDVETQLNDGVRLCKYPPPLTCALSNARAVQGQVHPLNGTLRYCHTSCDLLNAGTVVDYLTRVVNWINDNPFQVVTLVIANGDYVDVKEFVDPIETSGLAQLAYIPENRTMTYKEWPTLSDLILKNKRAIIFMDYQANETEVPYILDEFTYMWETKFSQTDPSFPCNVDRPPDVGGWMDKMYMANHNLFVAPLYLRSEPS